MNCICGKLDTSDYTDFEKITQIFRWIVNLRNLNLNQRNHSSRGMTLLELLIASSLGLVVLLALGQVDVTSIILGNQAKSLSTFQAEAAFTMTHLARSLQQADRVNLISSSNVQIRIPTGTSFDAPGNYKWVQYRHDSGSKEIRYVDPASSCTVATRFRDIGSLDIRYRDESPAPPGGDPAVQDNNVLEFTVSSTTDPQTNTTFTFTGEVTMRAGAYTGLMTGLTSAGVSEPPAACS